MSKRLQNPYTRRPTYRWNPMAFVFVGFITCIGALAGSWLIGLTVALGILLLPVFFD